MRILCAAPPAYGLMLPIIPLVWAARSAGHEVLVATSGEMPGVIAKAGLPVADVCPGQDIWGQLTRAIKNPAGMDPEEMSEDMRVARASDNPFGFFTLSMTPGTVEAGRAFGADLIVHTSDHDAGAFSALKLGLPALEAGNRVSWSMRDGDFLAQARTVNDTQVPGIIRERLAIPDGAPKPLARLDIRAPSMGGLSADEPDSRDGQPWWPMRYVPFNGGAELPEWTLRRPERPRVCVTLGTVVPVLSGVSNLSVVIEALGALDVDVVLAAGEADISELGALPANVRSVGFVPLSTIMPSCSLIVHHGGSGTTAAPLFYGVPQLVLPSFADNPMSAQRVADRGVGLQQDPASITVDGATELINRLLTEPAFATAAREVAEEIAAMPSPNTVIERLEAAMRQG